MYEFYHVYRLYSCHIRIVLFMYIYSIFTYFLKFHVTKRLLSFNLCMKEQKKIMKWELIEQNYCFDSKAVLNFV